MLAKIIIAVIGQLMGGDDEHEDDLGSDGKP
jgi:hypothetical protein